MPFISTRGRVARMTVSDYEFLAYRNYWYSDIGRAAQAFLNTLQQDDIATEDFNLMEEI